QNSCRQPYARGSRCCCCKERERLRNIAIVKAMVLGDLDDVHTEPLRFADQVERRTIEITPGPPPLPWVAKIKRQSNSHLAIPVPACTALPVLNTLSRHYVGRPASRQRGKSVSL